MYYCLLRLAQFKMIEELREALLPFCGTLLISDRYAIPACSAKCWISISAFETLQCLILGKRKRFYFYVGVSSHAHPPMFDFWKSTLEERKQWELARDALALEWRTQAMDLLRSVGCQIICFTPSHRVMVHCMGQMDRLSVVGFVYSDFTTQKVKKLRSQMSAWRQVARCGKLKKELMQRSCHPSRLLQI